MLSIYFLVNTAYRKLLTAVAVNWEKRNMHQRGKSLSNIILDINITFFSPFGKELFIYFFLEDNIF